MDKRPLIEILKPNSELANDTFLCDLLNDVECIVHIFPCENVSCGKCIASGFDSSQKVVKWISDL